MRKAVILIAAFILLIAGASFVEAGIPEQAGQLGLEFSEVAMAKFAEECPGEDTAILINRTRGYAEETAKIMLEGGVRFEAAESIMMQSAGWYATTLTQILRGIAMNDYTNEYIRKITGLFSEYKLDLPVQSNIVLLTSHHFQKMNSVLNRGFYNFD